MLAIGVFLFWISLFYKYSITNPALYWLPLADITALLLASYIHNDSNNLINSADGLEQYKYNYKNA